MLDTENIQDIAAQFSQFHAEHYSHVLRYVRLRLKDSNLVEDVVQETFLRAWVDFNKLRNHPNPRGWLFVTARNLVTDNYRAQDHQGKLTEMLAQESESQQNHSFMVTCCS